MSCACRVRAKFVDAKKESEARAAESAIKPLGGHVYENGRVANKSIVSVDAPDFMKGPFESNAALFSVSRQVGLTNRLS